MTGGAEEARFTMGIAADPRFRVATEAVWTAGTL
jgi:hypothetical protein